MDGRVERTHRAGERDLGHRARDDVWAAGGHGVVHSTGDGAWTTMHEDANDEYQAVLRRRWLDLRRRADCSGGVCRRRLLLASSDGGKTWAKQTLGSGVDRLLRRRRDGVRRQRRHLRAERHFATTTTMPLGWATSYGVFADGGAIYAYGGMRGAQIRGRTTDGGKSWTTVYSGFSGSQSGYMNGLARGGARRCSRWPTAAACRRASARSSARRRRQPWLARRRSRKTGSPASGRRATPRSSSAATRSCARSDAGATFTRSPLPVDNTILALWGARTNELYAVGGTARSCTASAEPGLRLLHVRIAVVGRRRERLLDRARRDPADEVPQRARLVVGARRARAAERLLPDDGAGRLVVDVEVAGRVAQARARLVDRRALARPDRAGERVRRGLVDQLQRLLPLAVGVDVAR